MLRSTLSKSRSKLFPSKTKEKEAEEIFDAGPKTPILDTYKENTTVEENDDEDFGSFSYDDEYYSESDLEAEPKREVVQEEKKYSRLERLRRSRTRSRSFSRSRSRSRSQSKSRWEEEEEEEAEQENNVKNRGRRKPTTEGVVKRSGLKLPIEESPRGGERSKRGAGTRAEEQKRYMRMGKYGRGVATTDEETEERDFEDEEDTTDRRRRSRKNSRRSYATDEDEDDDGDERRLEVHQSREELDQDDKPAMQVLKLPILRRISRLDAGCSTCSTRH